MPSPTQSNTQAALPPPSFAASSIPFSTVAALSPTVTPSPTVLSLFTAAFYCCVTKKLLTEPVTLTCGATIEKNELAARLTQASRQEIPSLECPCCHKEPPHILPNNLAAYPINFALKTIIETEQPTRTMPIREQISEPPAETGAAASSECYAKSASSTNHSANIEELCFKQDKEKIELRDLNALRAMRCPVSLCYYRSDSEEQYPLLLNCGHSLSHNGLFESFNHNIFVCPICKTDITGYQYNFAIFDALTGNSELHEKLPKLPPLPPRPLPVTVIIPRPPTPITIYSAAELSHLCLRSFWLNLLINIARSIMSGITAAIVNAGGIACYAFADITHKRDTASEQTSDLQKDWLAETRTILPYALIGGALLWLVLAPIQNSLHIVIWWHAQKHENRRLLRQIGEPAHALNQISLKKSFGWFLLTSTVAWSIGYDVMFLLLTQQKIASTFSADLITNLVYCLAGGFSVSISVVSLLICTSAVYISAKLCWNRSTQLNNLPNTHRFHLWHSPDNASSQPERRDRRLSLHAPLLPAQSV